MFPNTLYLFPTGEYQVPRLETGGRLQRMSDLDVNSHVQFNDTRMQDPQGQASTLPMTPLHEAPQSHSSPLESPIYGQTVDLPHYELMIVNALQAINDPNGSPPKAIWEWMNTYFLLEISFNVVIIHVTQSSEPRRPKLYRRLLRRVVC